MEVELDTDRSAARNASELFERAKKLEQKAEKAREVLRELEKKLERMGEREVRVKEVMKIKKEREWYEKFRWFFSSTGKLVIGGRDATSNEVLMKKHAGPEELCFHADIKGAPFFVLKGGADEESVREVVQAAGIFSKAWSAGYGAVDVFYAPRERFTKQAPSGEYIGKGAFMVYGKKDWGRAELRAAVGVREGRVTCGPPAAIEAWAEKSVLIEPGDRKPGEIIREVAKRLDAEPEEVQRALPPGRSKIIK